MEQTLVCTSQIYGEDFTKFCGFLRMYEIYDFVSSKVTILVFDHFDIPTQRNQDQYIFHEGNLTFNFFHTTLSLFKDAEVSSVAYYLDISVKS